MLIGKQAPILPIAKAAFHSRSALFKPAGSVAPRSTRMSWMDSWSRPSKGQATPAPYYSLPGGEATAYCHSCGRVIGSRRTSARHDDATPVKYCSSRCQSRKPGKMDREIERTFVSLLNEENMADATGKNISLPSEHGTSDGERRSKHFKRAAKGVKVKGDARVLISCDEVEEVFFNRKADEGDEADSDTRGQDAQETSSVQQFPQDHATTIDLEQDTSTDESYVDGDRLARLSVRSGTRVRPPQSVSEVNGSVGGEKGRAERITETEEMLEKRKQGQRRAKEREMNATRMGVQPPTSIGWLLQNEIYGKPHLKGYTWINLKGR
ncbi:hypothetical protein B0I35DRAFT_514154 [Stachybotrys elegans]|uniref:Uncharacterized protein n=1 Tax=Stachybotrys elegans TaxID=80388 RepID=A0A8K0SPE3_9HYPO|nr:hypothetical protein B0I35DRAFT_514154 [Stachybotrys elegans]